MSARWIGPAALLALAVGVAVGCSAIVESELARVNCSWEGAIGPPACPAGQACRAGVCSPCGKKEICGDGVDNDCNGAPDDACDDAGVGGAGAGGGSGGDTGGAPSGGGAGAAGAGGSLVTGGTSGSGGSTGGSGGSAGTGATGGSGGTSAGAIGASCASTTECNATLFCENPAVFGAATGPTVCTRGCCKSEDCGSGASVCYPAVGGGSACVPGSSVGRAELGTAAAGAACSKHADCRSGLCEASKCFDACCSDADCSGSQVCTKRTLPGTTRSVMACGTGPGVGGYQAVCSSDSQCQSAICSSNFYCSKSCCTAKDCAGFQNFVCVHTAGLRRCAFPGFTPGSKLLGVACTSPADCKSGHCLGPTGGPFYCSDTCCSDFDCGTGFGCRAASVSGTNQLLCLKL